VIARMNTDFRVATLSDRGESPRRSE